MARLQMTELLARLDAIEPPSSGFADALLRDLELELGFDDAGETDGGAARMTDAPPDPHVDVPPNVVPLRRRLQPPARWLAAAAAVLIVVVGASVAVQVARPVTALAVIDEAIVSFEDVPPFKATLRYDLNPEGKDPDAFGPKGGRAEVDVYYGGPTKFRSEITAVDTRPELSRGGAGSFIVYDGEDVGRYTANEKRFLLTSGEDFDPKLLMGWNGPGSWEDVCRTDDSRVLGTGTVAGRPAHHVRCGERFGSSWDLYVDTETGLVLKVDGALGGDDYSFGTTSGGGFEITSIDYQTPLPQSLFEVAPPEGVKTQTPPQGYPSFRATVTRTYSGEAIAEEFPDFSGGDFGIVSEIMYAADGRWRQEVVETTGPEPPEGFETVGSFTLWDGQKMWRYDATSKTYSGMKPDLLATMVPMLTHASVGPAEEGEWQSFKDKECRAVGNAEIAGREAVRLRCNVRMFGAPDVWLDADTEIVLRVRYNINGGHDVTSIEYGQGPAADTFVFEPPEGARDAEEAAQDPTNTALEVGQAPPSWSGTTLDGAPFTVESTTGKPTVVLLWADWCMTATPKCDVLDALDEVARDFGSSANVVLVAVDSDEANTRTVTDGMAFAVVTTDEAVDAWQVPGVPFWVALDAAGNVRETRVGNRSPETPDEIRTFLEAATDLE